jgi:hypothetical protein
MQGRIASKRTTRHELPQRKGRARQPGQIINPLPLKGGCKRMIPEERPERTG